MATNLNQQVPGMTSPTTQSTTSTTAMPWKSYNQYFTDKGQGDEASKWSNYHSSYMPGTTDNQQWGAVGNPFRFSEEYNQYKTTLPQQYQDLINYGISPEQVQSGQVKSIMRGNGLEKIQLPGSTAENPLYAGVGSGSSFSLGEDVLNKMWR